LSNLALTLRRPALILCLFGVGLLFLALPLVHLSHVPPVLLFIGRLHPLILHFPIVLIILALLFELAGRYYRLRIGENIMMVILVAAALSGLTSVVAGYLLFSSGEYSGRLIERHLWAGVITGLCIFFTLAFFFLHRQTARFYYPYFAALLLTNLAVGYTSHLGGSITHGQDYLSEHLQLIFAAPDGDDRKPESEMLVFSDMLLPVFEAKCLSCHNDERAKSDFSMTSYQHLLRGGESGHPAVVAGKPDSSEVYRRIILPEGDNDRMPPEGKTPLSPAEITLLKFWIAAGASDSLGATQALRTDTLKQVIAGLLPELEKYRRRARIRKMKLTELKSELREVAADLDIEIRPDSVADDDLFSLRMKFPPAPFNNDQFSELRPYFDVFSRVSLASSGIDDAGLYYIGQMQNVRELYLQKTALKGPGILYLQKLPKLEVLNLSFTRIDDKAALDLLKFPSLREVYLYRTSTSMQVIEALRKYRPEVRFLVEEGSYF
jgi:uncharacterized membrane protein